MRCFRLHGLGAAAIALIAAAAGGGCISDRSSSSCTAGPAVRLDWTITDTNGATQTCAPIGASIVVLYLDNTGYALGCDQGTGVTRRLPRGGTYTARAQLENAVGQPLDM